MKQSNFNFSDPYVYDLKFNDNVDFDPKNFEEMPITMDTVIDRMDSEPSNKAWVSVKIGIGDSKNAPFILSISMRALFSWEDSIDEEMLHTLLNKNSVALLISYARPIVANLTSFSRYPTFNIPFLDLNQED